MAPPAESPVTKTRCALILCSPTIRAIICRIEQASPCPRAVSSGLNQLKQPSTLLARDTGSSVARGIDQPQPEQIVAAVQNKKTVCCHSPEFIARDRRLP